jgi:uncharacterized protein (DUF2164 family)
MIYLITFLAGAVGAYYFRKKIENVIGWVVSKWADILD